MARELIRVDPEALRQRVEAVMERFPEVAGVYLFGSGRGLLRPDSDLDLGVILAAPVENVSLFEGLLEAELGSLDGHPFSVLRLTPGPFAFRVLREGVLLYERDANAVIDFIEFTARAQEREGRFLRTFARSRRARLSLEGGAGGR